MRLLIDMNMSPDLCSKFQAVGREALHWSALGAEIGRKPAAKPAITEHGKLRSGEFFIEPCGLGIEPQPNKPARTTVQVVLPAGDRGALVEIDVIAVRPK